MNTKTSILTALVALASGTAAMAQVYSQNVVGYVNVNLVPGFNLLANPLVNGTNHISQVVPTAPEGAELSIYTNGAFQKNLFSGGVWYDAESELPSNTKIAPGQGFLLYTLANGASLTFVGEVKQGANTVKLANGFSLVGSVAPQTYSLRAPNFPEVNDLLHYSYNNGFTISVFNNTVGWYDQQSEEVRDVQTSPGKGFFIYNSGTPIDWNRTYNVN